MIQEVEKRQRDFRMSAYNAPAPRYSYLTDKRLGQYIIEKGISNKLLGLPPNFKTPASDQETKEETTQKAIAGLRLNPDVEILRRGDRVWAFLARMNKLSEVHVAVFLALTDRTKHDDETVRSKSAFAAVFTVTLLMGALSCAGFGSVLHAEYAGSQHVAGAPMYPVPSVRGMNDA